MNLPIKNTNLTLIDGTYIVYLTNNPGGIGERDLLLATNPATIKKYIKAGYYIFGHAELYLNDRFFMLNKSLKQATRQGRQIVITNSLWHINNHIANGSRVHVEIYPSKINQ